MNKILPPIRLQNQGPAVANFQEAVLFIVDKRQSSAQGLSLAQRRQTLTAEIAAQSFGELTGCPLVGLLTDLPLPSPDFVNEPIAERLNQTLERRTARQSSKLMGLVR